MATKKKMLQAAAGQAGGEALNVEDVFSTYLYDGTSAEHTITNGIDLAGEGGMIWGKIRSATDQHWIVDSERGIGSNSNYKYVMPNLSTSELDFASRSVSSFNSDGFTLQNGTDSQFNESGQDYASWTFRKAPKFFDVVTYTGNGVAGRTLSHSLGSVPGMVLIKPLTTGEWSVYHRGLDSTSPEDYYLSLDVTAARVDDVTRWNDTAPTSTEITLGNNNRVNENGEPFVAYFFAHNDGDGEFGADGDADIIKCGSYTGNGTAGHVIDLGFEAQWVMVKCTNSNESWIIYDVMRGMPVDGNGARIRANDSEAESSITRIGAASQGFQLTSGDGECNFNGNNYIYIAIRRGTKVPEIADEVFDISNYTGNGTVNRTITTSNLVDLAVGKGRYNTTFDWALQSRLQGGGVYLQPHETNPEGGPDTGNRIVGFDNQTGFTVTGSFFNDSGSPNIIYSWKRAPGYFDVVAYTGNGTAGRTVSHNLGVAPEMMWVKQRPYTSNWAVYHKDIGAANKLILDTSSATVSATSAWNSTAPTSSVFTLGSLNDVNENPLDHMAYLFASLDGISKVGSFSHTSGSTTDVDCGFSSGARFVLFKRTSGSGVWFVFDAERGIVSGDDPYLRLDDTSAQIAIYDLIDPLSSGFTVGTPVGTGDYIFYAIA